MLNTLNLTMKFRFIVPLMLMVCIISKAQISYSVPFSLSVAQTSVASTDQWSVFHNPATLGYISSSEAGIQFQSQFLIHELSTKSVNVAYASKLGNTGVSFSHFGYPMYHQMLFGLTFARNFSDKFALGLQMNYYTVYFASTQNYKSSFFPQVGLTYQFTPDFSIGFHAFNPIQTRIKTDYTTQYVPSIFSVGTSYQFTTDLVWRTQFDKEIHSNYRVATGFEYQLLKAIGIKLGAYQSYYLIPCMGFNVKVGTLQFDLNTELHPLLGLSTMGSVKFKFGNKQ